MAITALLMAGALYTSKPSTEPQQTQLNNCALFLEVTGVGGKKVTAENVGKLFGAALALRVHAHRGTPLEGTFTQADLDGAARDIGACFLLVPQDAPHDSR